MGRGDREVRAGPARPPPPRQRPPRRRRARAGGAGPRRRRHLVRSRRARRRRARRDLVGPAAARRGPGRQEPGDEARPGAAPAARAAAARDDRHPDREPARRALGDHGPRQSRPARLARVVRPHVREAHRGPRRRARARAAPLDRAALRPPAREGRARGRARAAADHDREGLLPSDRRAGEPLPRHRRPLAATDRGARGPLRPPRRRARDAQPPQAGLQPPGAAGRDRAPARRPLREARAARSAPGRGARGRQVARLHAVPRLRPPRAAPGGAARGERRLLPRTAERPAARRSCWRRSSGRTGRPCS